MPPIRAVHQILPTVAFGDAIGNHVLGLRRVLQGWGYQSEIFAQHWHPGYGGMVQPYQSYPRFSHPDNLLLLHYSIGGEVNRYALELPDRLVIYYHNITPPKYFVPYSGELAVLVDDARRELGAYARRAPAIADSAFNGGELQALGYDLLGVVPPVLPPEVGDDSSGPAAGRLRRRYAQPGSTDWLHVGRLAPNKCIQDIIKSFYYYHAWINPASRLLLVGTGDGLEHYVNKLYALVTRLGLDGKVIFTGQVETTAPFYSLASLYVAMSEHEGFCIPLIESMRHDVPVLAYGSTAVPETMGGAGVLVRRKAYPAVAEMAHEMVSNPALRARLLAVQRQRMAAYAPVPVEAELRACLERAGAGQFAANGAAPARAGGA